MLTPQYLQMCAYAIELLYEELNQNITNDIARRIVKTGNLTISARRQVRILQESGKLMDEIIADIANSAGMMKEEIARMFQEAGIKSMQFDAEPLISAGINANIILSPAMQQILEANMRKTQQYMGRLTMTTASTGQDTFISAMNEAQMKVQSGAFSYQEAFRRAIEQCADIGAKILYPTGARLSLEAAARTNILTGVSQTANKITEMNCVDLGAEYVETSAHAGARPTHAEWQGQVFMWKGSSREYRNFADATGYGTGDGLGGYNCRHSFYPYFPGISRRIYTKEVLESFERKKYTYNDTEYTEYEASQIQRRMERDIRDAKRRLNALESSMDECRNDELRAALEDSRDDARELLSQRRKKLTDFCNQTGMKKDYIRTKVA